MKKHKAYQVLVRNLDETVKSRLQRRAKQHDHSVEQEIRDILRDALKEDDRPRKGLGTEIAELFKDIEIEKPIPKLKIKLRVPKF
jgi:plasmid stability protein